MLVKKKKMMLVSIFPLVLIWNLFIYLFLEWVLNPGVLYKHWAISPALFVYFTLRQGLPKLPRCHMVISSISRWWWAFVVVMEVWKGRNDDILGCLLYPLTTYYNFWLYVLLENHSKCDRVIKRVVWFPSQFISADWALINMSFTLCGQCFMLCKCFLQACDLPFIFLLGEVWHLLKIYWSRV